MADNTDLLRPEARPIQYSKHHWRARQALDFIITLLKDAVVKASKSKVSGSEASIDRHRASRIVFISGEPGSGKSTLYLTLRALLELQDEDFVKDYDGINNLDGLKNIHWLDPLDLEVAGDEGENLLAAVLVRLFRKLEASSKVHPNECQSAIKQLEDLATDIGIAWEGNLKDRAAALDPDTFSTEVMRTQRARIGINERLKEALDRVSENNCYGCTEKTLFLLPVDDFYLKPEASLHLLRLLRMISIPRLFFLVMGDIDTVEALFIEKSLGDWTTVAGKELFAERTDRLDGALTRARELRARYLRKLLPPGQRAEIEAMDWDEALEFQISSNDGQARGVTLEQILGNTHLDSPYRRQNKKPHSLLSFLISPPFSYLNTKGQIEDSKYSTEKDRLKEIRSKVKKNQLNDSERKEEEKRIEMKHCRSAYTALQILDATPREIIDLRSALQAVERERAQLQRSGTLDVEIAETPLFLLQIRDMVNLVKEEQSFLNEEEQSVIEGVLPTRHYSPQDLVFEMDRLCLRPAPRAWKPNHRNTNTSNFWFRTHRSWNLSPRLSAEKIGHRVRDLTNANVTTPVAGDNPETSLSSMSDIATENIRNPFSKLPPRPSAWFVLLHDLAWSWYPDSLTSNLIQRFCDDLNAWDLSVEKVKLKRNIDTCSRFEELRSTATSTGDPLQYFSGWAICNTGNSYKHFPIPIFETFRQLDQFLYVWSRGLRWLIEEQEVDIELGHLISIWSLAGLTILKDLYPMFSRDVSKWYKDFSDVGGIAHDREARFNQTLSKRYSRAKALQNDLINEWFSLDTWPQLEGTSQIVTGGHGEQNS